MILEGRTACAVTALHRQRASAMRPLMILEDRTVGAAIVWPGDPAELENIEAEVAELSGPMSAMIERVYGLRIAEVEQSLQAISLDEAAARSLRTEPGSPALKAIRRYFDADGRLIELAVALHPGDRFTYVSRLKRE